ncbi:glycoside hydrolase family 3 protein [Psychromicrobium lacuslunae]|uniref:glycoside hydrolase family 3 protein n=1 Tax=Psychromicrobium lacuslunae TaxID=1618207 RepID=UPI0005D31907|nr:glycoside hydrolase family 3 N-terminal domain-containing protein [Psychromicrobium lacuslunae]
MVDTQLATTGSATPEELKRLVNSVIWPGFNGRTLPDWLRTALQEGLAGVVYFRQNVDPDDPQQLSALSAEIRAANPRAIIGVDEEGGSVSRLEAKNGSSLPGAAVLGQLNDLALTEAAGRHLGQLCLDAGINLNLAPVADVNTNPANPVIGIRSFGSDTDLVSRHSSAMLRGIQSLGVGACAKHFPGHGDTVTDSHLALPRLEMSFEELSSQHLPPMRATVESGVRAVMTAHIVVPGLGDEEAETPATLNPAAGELLRSFGFDGLQITDALDMAAIKATVGSGRGAVLAMLAGADLLCLGNPANPGSRSDKQEYQEVFQSLLLALAEGELPIELFYRAQRRISEFLDWSEGQQAKRPTVEQSASGLIDWPSRVSTALRSNRDQTPRLLAGEVQFCDLRGGHNLATGKLGNFFSAALSEFRPVRLRSLEELKALKQPNAEQAVVVLVDSLIAGGSQLSLLNELAAELPELVCINAGLAPSEDPVPTTLSCFDSSRVTARAVAQLLVG